MLINYVLGFNMKFRYLSSKLRILFGTTCMFCMVYSSASRAGDELIFATPPTQSVEETQANFQPLMEYLSRATGKKISIHPARNYFQYSREMREGKYDVVFDGGHFVDYRIEKLHHTLLVKQPGQLRFVVIVRKDSKIYSLKDLVTKSVCAPHIPHLATLSFLDLFPNPARQPEMLPVQGFKAGINCIANAKAEATVVRDVYLFKKVKNAADYRVIFTTERKMPARAITVSPRVDQATRQKMYNALMSVNGNIILSKAFSTFGGTKFVAADQKEYAGLGELLQVVWGFNI